MKAVVFCAIVLASLFSFAADAGSMFSSQSNGSIQPQYPNGPGSYYDWGTAQNGFGYCYQYSNYGQVLNGGQAQPNYLCEQRRPSYYNWGRASNGFGYCYQYTPYGVAMNQGSPQGNYLCEQRQPSYYSWGRGQDGYTRCYQYTPNGIPMNQGSPVGNYLCQ